MIIRTFLKLKHGGKEEFEILPNGQRRQFQDLMSHRAEMVLDSDIMSVVANVYANIKNIMNGKNHPTKSEVLEIYGKNRINQIYIYTKNITKVGFGVYLGNFALEKYFRETSKMKILGCRDPRYKHEYLYKPQN